MVFGFIAALLALPLATLPILLHLLYRRRSPVVPFPTLRFVRESIQQTAARKRIQRWLLLACRTLLLALLIWAISQPAKILATNWSTAGQSTIAAIVVDTSYSMQLQEDQLTLLSRADSTIREMLRSQLRDARVALYRSEPSPADRPERLVPAGELLAEWSPLSATPASHPLLDRMGAAVEMLKEQDAASKWLIVLTDLQAREFPRPAVLDSQIKAVVLDLHPVQARSAGITSLSIQPSQPIAGLGVEANVEIAGQAMDRRAVSLAVTSLRGDVLVRRPPQVVQFDARGLVQARFDLVLPAERWLTLDASLSAPDDMPWDDSRQSVVEIPPKQNVTLIQGPERVPAERYVRLALDPSEGKQSTWPLSVRSAANPAGNENVIVELWTKFPDHARTTQLTRFVNGGGALICFLHPGLESVWDGLETSRKEAMARLLPAVPLNVQSRHSMYRVRSGGADDSMLAGLLDEKMDPALVRRFVPTTPVDPNAATLLTLTPNNASAGSRTMPLVVRRGVGAGRVFLFTTFPDGVSGNLGTHPIFLPLLVRMALRPPSEGGAQNMEIGQQLVFRNMEEGRFDKLDVHGPDGSVHQVAAVEKSGERRWTFDGARTKGVYMWNRPGEPEPLGVANVQLPGGESQLAYREAGTVFPMGENVLIARSLEQLSQEISRLNEPEPKWSWAIAFVLLLLCLEAWMASFSKLWNLLSLRSLLPRLQFSRSAV